MLLQPTLLLLQTVLFSSVHPSGVPFISGRGDTESHTHQLQNDVEQKQVASLHDSFRGKKGRAMPRPKVYRCGDIGSDMVANFVNRNYPNNDRAAGECTFRLVIQSHDICQIRVDLVDTELLGPSRGECLSQALTIEGALWPSGLPPICGASNDQHFYLHLEPWGTNTSLVDFKIVTVVKGQKYRFGVWITQIDCAVSNVLKSPSGCTQYFLSETGTIKTINYEGLRYLSGQNYKICIRTGKGVCGIRYDTAPGDFGIKKSAPGVKEIMQRSGVGTQVCGTDYLLIPGGRDALTLATLRQERLLFGFRRPAAVVQAPPKAQKPTTPSSKLSKRKWEVPSSQDRFCGGTLSPTGGDDENKPVFSRVRSNLITLWFKTAPLQEFIGKTEAMNLTTGFLIKYTQVRNCDAHTEEADATDMVVQSPSMHHAPKNKPVPQTHSLYSKLQEMATKNKNKGSSVPDNVASDRSDFDLDENDNAWDYLEEAGGDYADDVDLYDYFK